MEHPSAQRDTPAWIFQTWTSFALSFGTTAFGIVWLPADGWVRGFLAMGLLSTVTSSFTLAKTIRDNHEASRLINRISDARTEKLIREFEGKADVE
jgi:hypothetical protein